MELFPQLSVILSPYFLCSLWILFKCNGEGSRGQEVYLVCSIRDEIHYTIVIYPLQEPGRLKHLERMWACKNRRACIFFPVSTFSMQPGGSLTWLGLYHIWIHLDHGSEACIADPLNHQLDANITNQHIEVNG